MTEDIQDVDTNPNAGMKQKSSASSLAAGLAVVGSQAKVLPSSPGVYQMLNARGDVLYVGKAIDLKKRVASYAKPQQLTQRILRMISEVNSLEVVTTHTEIEALLLESNLIKRLKPRYNVLLRDDKSFAHIFISQDETWPMLVKHRGPQNIPGDYYGPFVSAGAVNRSLRALQRAFLLRSCSDSIFKNRTRPCLQHQIKRCSAPCVGYVSSAEYQELVLQAKQFLSGNSAKVQRMLSEGMQKASDELDFERAAIYRDRIHALSQIQSQQEINVKGMKDADIMALHTENGQSCIQIFFFRGGSNMGSRAYFPRHDQSHQPELILEAFIGQFYDNKKAPEHILLSHQIENAELISKALSQASRVLVKLSSPARGPKLKLIQHAMRNAGEALARNRAQRLSEKRLLEQVQKRFFLRRLPVRIEVYDNSHIQGTNAVGAMIVAGPDGFEKNHYRKFNIRPVTEQIGSSDLEVNSSPGDDYYMMRQVLRRRFSKKSTQGNNGAPMPDLVLLDGGRGHLSAALEVSAELSLENIRFAAISKGPDRNAGRERFYLQGRPSFSLNETDALLYYLQRLRDEAHRFALQTHRSRRIRSLTRSVIDDIPSVGSKRKKLLLHHFGSARAVSRAGLKDLELIDGISKNIARKIYNHFHGK